MFFCRVCVSPFLSFTMSCVSWKTARGRCRSSKDKVVTAGFPTLRASTGSCVLPQSYMMRDRVNVQTRFPPVNALPRKPNLQPRQTSCKVAKDAGVELSSTSSDLHVLSRSFGVFSQFLSPHWSLCEYAKGPYGMVTRPEFLSPPPSRVGRATAVNTPLP